MKRFILSTLFVFLFTASLWAQSSGGTGGSGSGGTGSGGSGSGGSGINTGNLGSSSSSSDSSSSSSPSQLGEDVTVPEFQGFESISNQDFIGRQNSNAPFVGREEVFNSSTTRGSTRTTPSTTATRRVTTTSRRTTGTRSMSTARTGTTGGREVRAATTTDFAFSPMEVSNRETSFRTRLGRLPNFRAIPEQVDIKISQTPTGTVATLSGTVSTERDRRLAKQLVLLEPGIDRVENNLVVAVDPTKKSESLPNLDGEE